MKKEWECKKCDHVHEWEVDFPGNWFKCKECKTLRWPGMVWALGGLITLLLIVGVWTLIPADNPPEKQSTKIVKNESKVSDKLPPQANIDSEIIKLLTQGEFLQAKSLVQTIQDDYKRREIGLAMETPLSIEVAFQYQKETQNPEKAQKPSPFYPIDSPEMNDLTLTNRDNYRLTISVSHPNTYLYIFQEDHYHQVNRLFPDPIWSKVDNPIQSGMVYQVPSEKWFYLDELPPSQEWSIAETLYIIAAPWKAEDIEHLYGKIHETTDGEIRGELVQEFVKRLRLRDGATFKSLGYKEFSFSHGK